MFQMLVKCLSPFILQTGSSLCAISSVLYAIEKATSGEWNDHEFIRKALLVMPQTRASTPGQHALPGGGFTHPPFQIPKTIYRQALKFRYNNQHITTMVIFSVTYHTKPTLRSCFYRIKNSQLVLTTVIPCN